MNGGFREANPGATILYSGSFIVRLASETERPLLVDQQPSILGRGAKVAF
jgi:hypothetical protein